jgi:hypothetical protein
MEETDISELYNFDYQCVYRVDTEDKTQYKYDLSQIISRPEDDDLYNVKLFGIFTILNKNEETKQIFNLIRMLLPEEYHDESSTFHNIMLFYEIISYQFLHLFHPCICDIYHDKVIKPENLNRLISFLNTLV